MGIHKVKTWSPYGNTLKNSQFHIHKINALSIGDQQNCPKLVRKCGRLVSCALSNVIPKKNTMGSSQNCSKLYLADPQCCVIHPWPQLSYKFPIGKQLHHMGTTPQLDWLISTTTTIVVPYRGRCVNDPGYKFYGAWIRSPVEWIGRPLCRSRFAHPHSIFVGTTQNCADNLCNPCGRETLSFEIVGILHFSCQTNRFRYWLQ